MNDSLAAIEELNRDMQAFARAYLNTVMDILRDADRTWQELCRRRLVPRQYRNTMMRRKIKRMARQR